MNVEALLAPDTSAPLGQTRARVLDLLRAAGGPLVVREVARRTGLHLNTARFHLDGLTEARLAVREPQPRTTPGRPSMAYRAVHGGDPAGARRYRLLAEMLTSLITGLLPDPGKAATEAGREWGGYLAEQPPPYQRLSARQAIEQLSGIMEKLGFTPQTVADVTRVRLCLHQCPFREVAQHHQDVVCALHLGLMQGALATMRAPVTADRLQPFAEPGLCVAHLTASEDPRAIAQPANGAR
jgi:predicted ArsR family transcriptional regulator